MEKRYVQEKSSKEMKELPNEIESLKAITLELHIF